MFKSQWAVQLQQHMPQFGFNKECRCCYSAGERTNFAGLCPRFCFLSSQAILDGVAISFCHRERAQRPWRSSYNRVAHTRVHYLLDCFVSLAMTRECGRYSFLVIARERSDRGDPVNAICVAYATTLFTGLLRCARNDKCVDCVAVRNDRLWIAPRMTRGGRAKGQVKTG